MASGEFGWGCSLLEAATMAATASTTRRRVKRREDSARDYSLYKHPEFFSPLSSMEAWDSSFFFAPALLLLSTLAFVVNLVPTLVSGLEEYWQ